MTLACGCWGTSAYCPQNETAEPELPVTYSCPPTILTFRRLVTVVLSWVEVVLPKCRVSYAAGPPVTQRSVPLVDATPRGLLAVA